MSLYTTEVRFICETEYGLTSSKGANSVDEILTAVAPKIFNFDFPIFDENYRLTLEKNILRHFYTREIGSETVGLWKLRLEDKMNEIMPYFNKLFEMQVTEVNPLYNFNLKREGNNKGKKHEDLSKTTNSDYHDYQDGDTTDTSNTQSLYSDTPQNGLLAVQNGDYLTNATIDSGKYVKDYNTNQHGDNHGTDVGDNTITNDTEYSETVQGLSDTSVGDSWLKFIKGFKNINSMLYKELEVLFMQLW